MFEINKIATNLECGEHGIWFTKKRSHISYPEDGNLKCRSIEDDSVWFKHRNKCILEALRLFPPGGAVFDVGAGNGYVSLAIKKAGFDTVVVEPGLQGVMNAHARGLNPVICSTLEDAGFKHNLIPAVGLFDLLEDIHDDIDFLRIIKFLLIPNGRLYITVPAYNFLWSIEDAHAGHYRRYKNKSIAITLESIGFKIDFKTYIFSILPLPIFLFRTIPSKLGLRKRSEFEQNRKEHSLNHGLFGSLINWALNKEIKLVSNKNTIMFGASCLLIARSQSKK